MISSNKILTLKNYHMLEQIFSTTSDEWWIFEYLVRQATILQLEIYPRRSRVNSMFWIPSKAKFVSSNYSVSWTRYGEMERRCESVAKTLAIGLYVYSILEYREDMIIWQQQSACVLFNKFSIVTIEKQQRIGLCNLCFIIDSVPLVNI